MLKKRPYDSKEFYDLLFELESTKTRYGFLF